MKLQMIVIAALIATFGQAQAENPAFEPVGPMQTFDFDTPDGHYQAWDTPVTCTVNAIRATVHFTRYGEPTTQFSPGVDAVVQNGTDRDGQFASLNFHATKFRPPFQITTHAGGSKTKQQRSTFSQQTDGGDWFSFEMRWTSQGHVSESVGTQIGTQNMRGRPEQIHLEGFSGAGEIKIQLGHYRIKDPTDSCHPIA